MTDLLPKVDDGDKDGRLSAVEALVRQLITNSVESDLATDRGYSRADWVILDIEVDGAHYQLLRVPEAQVPLSPRELEIARMVARGYPNKTIASVLDISTWTVASHLRRVFSKLGVSSRAAMVARLLEDVSTVDVSEAAHTYAHAPVVEPVVHPAPRPEPTRVL
jgi:two-component system, NarL family, nitrate/nitrite response regulator NarL